MRYREVYVGAGPDMRAFVRVGLGTVTYRTSVEHQPIKSATVVSFSGWTTTMDGQDLSAGQIRRELELIDTPAEAFSDGRLQGLIDTWREWHMNDLQAGCAHQTVVMEDDPKYGYRRPSLTLTEPCPATGYRYGSEWLMKPLPADLEAALERFVDGSEWEIQH